MKVTNFSRTLFAISVGVFFFLPSFPELGNTQVPQKINYQGYLSSAVGVPINGTVQMVFSIYNAAAGGDALWTETQNVTVSRGVYNVNLGEVTPIALTFDIPYYLGITVGSDSEMVPRNPFASVGYAIRAKTVERPGVQVYDSSQPPQFLGFFLGYKRQPFDYGSDSSYPVVEIFVPSLNKVTYINLHTTLYQTAGDILKAVIYFYPLDCVGQPEIIWPNTLVGSYDSESFYLSNTNSILVGYQSRLAHDGCGNTDQCCYLMFEAVKINRNALPFTVPVVLPLQFK